MRILQVCKFFQPVMGGIETVAWELAEGFARAGLRGEVLCSNQRRDTERQVFPAGYDVVRAGSLGMVLSTSMSPAMVRELRRMSHGRDVIHVHMPDPMAALAVWTARPKARLVVHWHSDVVRQRRAMKFYEPLQRWLLERADAVITTSAAYANSSLALRPWLNKVSVIPIGISDNRGQDHAPKTAAIREEFRGRKIVFALGRMTYYKGFEVLIEAARSLPDDSVVVIGGDGPEMARYREAVQKHGVEGKVVLLGHINDGDLPSYYEACDVFCMSSTVRSEAYGVTMVEAMVMGKPVVSTDIVGSGVPWVNVDGVTGFNTPVGQPEPLAATLSQLLDDAELRQRMGTAARERYLHEFHSDWMTQKTIGLYDTLLRAPRHVRAAVRMTETETQALLIPSRQKGGEM
jgi:glycosyltransferase involved in cell wall biosynthesis